MQVTIMDLIAFGISLAKMIICDDAFEAEPVAIETSAVDRAIISLTPSPTNATFPGCAVALSDFTTVAFEVGVCEA